MGRKIMALHWFGLIISVLLHTAVTSSIDEPMLSRHATNNNGVTANRQLYKVIQDQVGTTSSHIFLSLAKPGLAVDPKDYEDAYSPVNPNGNMTNLWAFSSRFCDPSPHLDTFYMQSGSVSTYYELLVNSQTSNPAIAGILSQYKEKFQASRLGIPGLPGDVFHPCFAQPSNWFDESSNQWTTITVDWSKSSVSYDDFDFDKFGGSGQSAEGLWTKGGSFGNPTAKAVRQEASFASFHVSLSYQRVDLQRTWLSQLIFHLTGYTAASPPGSFSNGYKDPNNTYGLFPLLPSYMIVVKDVTIECTLSGNEQDLLAEAQKGTSVALGPFALTKGTTYGNGKLRLEGMQVIGFVNEVLPELPPKVAAPVTGPYKAASDAYTAAIIDHMKSLYT